MVTARSSLTVPGAAAAAKVAADQGADKGGRSDGNAIPAAVTAPAPPRSRREDHSADPRVNPDASRFYAAGSAGRAPYG